MASHVAIVGSRNYPTEEYHRITSFIKALPAGTTIVSGDGRGVDKFAAAEAERLGYPTLIFPARWNTNGYVDKGAGFKRNHDIVDNASDVMAFYDGKSNGTMHTLGLAQKAQHIRYIGITLPNGLKFAPSKHYPLIFDKNVIYASGDMLLADVDCIVNPCNTVGVYGAGLSKQIFQKFKWAITEYVKVCKSGSISVGHPYLSHVDNVKPSILHFPTKDHWKNASRLEYITEGLGWFKGLYTGWKTYHDIRTYAFPMLGCGLGGLDWWKVEPIMLETFHAMKDVTFVIFIDDKTARKSDQDWEDYTSHLDNPEYSPSEDNED